MPLLGRKVHKYRILFREGFNEKTSKFKEFSINILTLPSPPSLEKSFFPPQFFLYRNYVYNRQIWREIQRGNYFLHLSNVWNIKVLVIGLSPEKFN